MPKFLPILRVAAFVLFFTGCQRAEQVSEKNAVLIENAPTFETSNTPTTKTAEQAKLVLPLVSIANLKDATLNAEAAFASGHFDGHGKNQAGALEWYLAILSFDGNNRKAQAGLKNTVEALVAMTRQSVREADLDEAIRLLQVLNSGVAERADIDHLNTELTLSKQANAWFQKAQALETNKIILATDVAETDGGKNHAVAAYRNALGIFPDFQPAIRALDRLRSQRERAAVILAGKSKFQAALIALKQAESVDADNLQYQMVYRLVHGRLNQVMQEKIVLANLALDGLRIESALVYYNEAKQILPTHPEVTSLAIRIDNVLHYGRLKPRQTFSDAWAMSTPAPEMVVVPYGTYEMGAPRGASAAVPVELPRHAVKFERGFAIARNEITVGQFRQFIESTAYQTRSNKQGWSLIFDEKGGSMTKRNNIDWHHDHLGRIAKEELPVVHVNWHDANAYAKWLSLKTGESYRLPSEAEFEYVLRADRDSRYPWGNELPKKVVANLAGAGDKSTQNRSWGNAIADYRDFHWGAASVRSFPEEPWGTFDISGNVEEWVQDCWHDSYQRAPVNGTAWVNPGCKTGVTRGASWASSLNEARVSFRAPTLLKTHNARIGFRVVRSL